MRTVPRSPIGRWPAGPGALLSDDARLSAAASSSYRPALPLAHLLPAVARSAVDPRSHGWTVIAIAMGMFNGYVRPKHARKR